MSKRAADATKNTPELLEPLPARPPVAVLRSVKGRVVYYLTFLACVVALANFFQAWRETATAGAAAAITAVAWGVMLASTFVVLMVYTYEGARTKGELTRESPLLERLLGRLERGD